MGALERENQYLRDEIERAKYSKDKEEYNRFVSGLTQVRKKPALYHDKENSESFNFAPSIPKQPLGEVSTNNFNDTKKKIDFHDKDNSSYADSQVKGHT